MTKLPYLHTMFATCMLFQSIFVLCVLLWLGFPELQGHALLRSLSPGFRWISIGAFFYGLIASMAYGWVAAAIFVFFFNLWPAFAASVYGRGGPMRQ